MFPATPLGNIKANLPPVLDERPLRTRTSPISACASSATSSAIFAATDAARVSAATRSMIGCRSVCHDVAGARRSSARASSAGTRRHRSPSSTGPAAFFSPGAQFSCFTDSADCKFNFNYTSKAKQAAGLPKLKYSHWQDKGKGAADKGVGSLLSFQLFVTGDNLGALNLYATQPHAFDEESESVGLVFASHASIALAGAQQEERLRTAIASRDLIGQAKGILMERFRITADQAFRVLVGASSRTNRRLADIAAELCSTGELPRPAPRHGRPV